MPTIGPTGQPTGGADEYPTGFIGCQRLQMPEDGFLDTIKGWVDTGNTSGAAFRFFIDTGTSSAPSARIFYSGADIPLTANAPTVYQQSLGGIFVPGGTFLWCAQIDMSGETRFMYEGAAGSLIYDAYYGGGPVPPDDPVPSGELNLYTDYRYGVWLEYTAGSLGAGAPPLLMGSLW